VEAPREQEAEHHLPDQRRPEHEDQRDLQRVRELRVGERLAVVLRADELRLRGPDPEQLVVREPEVDRPQGREDQKDADEAEGRGDESDRPGPAQ
jgi:hypothetical protein